jgi:hypothetical protein
MYDPDTGVFRWKVNRPGGIAKKGSVAGYVNRRGYQLITVDGRHYRSHRLAWMYMHGYFPENQIDHINRNPADNQFENLREVSQVCNTRNSRTYCTNTSGVKGVSFEERNLKWSAGVMVDNNTKHLGYYDDFADAVCARLAAEQCLGWAGCDSDSSAYKYVKELLKRCALTRRGRNQGAADGGEAGTTGYS